MAPRKPQKGSRGQGGRSQRGGSSGRSGGRGPSGNSRSGGRSAGGSAPRGPRRASSGADRGRGGSGQRRGSGTGRGDGALGGGQVEGRQAVRELLLAGRRRTREVYLGNEVERVDIVSDIVELASELGVPVRSVSRSKLDHIARTESPQGVVAMAESLPASGLSELNRARDGRPPFLVALDGVTDPQNLGSVIRIAECAGVDGILLPKHRAAHVTPTVTKAAAGAVEYMPMAVVGGLPSALEQLRSAGTWVVGLDAGGDTPMHEVKVADEGVCLVLGAEGAGLSRLVRERCDVVASIPLRGRLASLNVASAAAVACYDVARMRS